MVFTKKSRGDLKTRFKRGRVDPMKGKTFKIIYMLTSKSNLVVIVWSCYTNVYNNQGENDGYMTMVYHGLPWFSMVIQPWSTIVDHVLLNGRPWLTMVKDHCQITW